MPGPFSFDRAELDGCRAAAGGQAPPPPFLPGPLPAVPADDVALDDLVTFAEHPVKQFLRQRVGLPISEADDDPADALPVALDALQRWAVGDRLLRDRLAGLDLARCRAAEWRRGELPPGELGNTPARRGARRRRGRWSRRAPGSSRARRRRRRWTSPWQLLPDGARVVGTVSGVYGDTAVRVEFSKLAAKQRVRAWVRLVALTAARPDRRWRAVTVGRGARGGVAVATVGPVDAARARGVLADLVALHREGLREPLPLPTVAAHAYARTRAGGGTADDALAEALRGWCEGRFPGARRGGLHPRVRPRGGARGADDGRHRRRADAVRRPRAAAVAPPARRGGAGMTAVLIPSGRFRRLRRRCPPAPPCSRQARAPARPSRSPRSPPATSPRATAALPELLLVTFGREATQELRERVRERLVSAERGAARPRRGAGGRPTRCWRCSRTSRTPRSPCAAGG